MKAPVTYVPNFITGVGEGRDGSTIDACDWFMDALWNDLAWLRLGSRPRREYFVSRVGEDYTYGAGDFATTYKPQPTTQAINTLWRHAEEDAKTTFDVCFLNGYDNERDHLGWHSDDSPEMDDVRPIAIVSLGAEREIWFRPKNASVPELMRLYRPEDDSIDRSYALHDTLLLQNGSLCLMAPGMQDTHQHRIPKGSRPCGPRISLTFRGYSKP